MINFFWGKNSRDQKIKRKLKNTLIKCHAAYTIFQRGMNYNQDTSWYIRNTEKSKIMFKKSPPNDDKVPIITDDSLENEVQNSDQHVPEGKI